MKSKMRTTLAAVTALCALAGGAAPILAGDGGAQRYAVTVTNLTRGQILSPPLVISHHRGFKLFEPGQPVGPELAQLAEDAVSGPLTALLGTLPGVLDYNLGTAVVMPGESATVEVETRGRFRTITVAGMLVTTNDALFSATGSTLPKGKAQSFPAIAYDAGSEANTESCDHIPGPPCGNGLVPVPEGAEGYVHVHAGIHGMGDLMPGMHDWRNPVAHVKLQRID